MAVDSGKEIGKSEERLVSRRPILRSQCSRVSFTADRNRALLPLSARRSTGLTATDGNIAPRSHFPAAHFSRRSLRSALTSFTR